MTGPVPGFGMPQTIQVRPPAAAAAAAGGSFKQALSRAITDLHALAGLADDPQDKQDVLKCLTALQGIQAAEAKENDAALTGKLSPRHMRRASGGGY